MGLTTLTDLERHWMDRAQRAVDNGETWEPCNECRRYHPVGQPDACDDMENRLPGQPEELLAQ